MAQSQISPRAVFADNAADHNAKLEDRQWGGAHAQPLGALPNADKRILRVREKRHENRDETGLLFLMQRVVILQPIDYYLRERRIRCE
jgi:hypothetical protein